MLFNHSDDYWSVEGAKVICRMLGYDPMNSVATTRSAYGIVSNDFILDDVQCRGDEVHIMQCVHAKRENCGSSEGAGVICESTGKFLIWRNNVDILHLVRSFAPAVDDKNDEKEAAGKKEIEQEQFYRRQENEIIIWVYKCLLFFSIFA